MAMSSDGCCACREPQGAINGCCASKALHVTLSLSLTEQAALTDQLGQPALTANAITPQHMLQSIWHDAGAVRYRAGRYHTSAVAGSMLGALLPYTCQYGYLSREEYSGSHHHGCMMPQTAVSIDSGTGLHGQTAPFVPLHPVF